MARVRSERDRFVGFVTRGVDEIPDGDKLRGYARFVDDTHAGRGRRITVHATADRHRDRFVDRPIRRPGRRWATG